MTYSDWAKQGNGMAESGQRIQEWIGDTSAYLFCAEKEAHYSPNSHRQERDLFASIQNPNIKSFKAAFGNLHEVQGKSVDVALVALIPFKEPEFEAIRRAIVDQTFPKIVIIITHEGEMSRSILRGFGAVNLETGEHDALPDPLLIEAAKTMVNEEYNGLGSGNGKDAVLSLIHAFRQAGYPTNKELWLAAYFAAGGKTRHAETVAKFIDEINKGTRHRFQNRFRPNIVEILKERVEPETNKDVTQRSEVTASSHSRDW
ncbi:hypothetical protein AB3K78_09120 [Leucobacter sp. HNU]|uniref:hypothetical protein n=1 Tax=Leucobacter sp. HNU TaxID=3236805 RepID=UPI003A80A793